MTDNTSSANARSAAYDTIARYLRNNLGDEDYADYSSALDCIYGVPAVRVELSAEQIEAMAREDAGGTAVDWTMQENLWATAPQRAAFRRGVCAILARVAKATA
jgi:hypothetical protein